MKRKPEYEKRKWRTNLKILKNCEILRKIKQKEGWMREFQYLRVKKKMKREEKWEEKNWLKNREQHEKRNKRDGKSNLTGKMNFIRTSLIDTPSIKFKFSLN